MKRGFTIALVLLVPCAALGASVTLRWTPPVFSCDGSALSDLAGYMILWGSDPGGPYPNRHVVDDPEATSAVVNVGAVEGRTLYFVTVSVDSSGNRSDGYGGCGASNEVAASFGAMPPSPPTGLTVMPQ